ncbi:MAG: T9SS type A sorting domain-containing protein, partial [Bacteroidota bacterium]|nr:T9SS type A sorting domain-containing protein [Bacteroidota bacterium]
NNGPVCEGEDVLLTGTTDIGTSFQWSGPALFNPTTQNATVPDATSANAGTYTFIATANGCSSTPATTNVVVNPLPTGVSADASSLVVCPAGETVDLTSTGTVSGTLLSTGFNSGNGGFTTTNNSTGGTPANAAWTLRPSPFSQSAQTFNSNDATQFYLSNSDAQGSGSTTNASLISPMLNTTGYTTLSLSFWHVFRPDATSDSAKVEVSTNGGATWTVAQQYLTLTGTPGAFVNATVNMNAFIGVSDLQIRFRHRASWGWYWAIDNVTLSGQQAPSFAWTSNPIGFVSTEQNPQDVIVNETTTYIVTVSSPAGCSVMDSVTVTVDETDTDGDGVLDCLDDCPNVAGQVGSICDSNPDPNQFGLGELNATCNCIAVPCTEDVTLEFQTDANGSQTSWEINPFDSELVICGGGGLPNSAVITTTCCLPEGCFKLRVMDSAGDGMTTGGYILRDENNQRIIDNRNNFNSGSLSAIANDGGFCLPIGTDRLIFTSCDKLDWVTNQFIVASLNPAVSAEWINGAPNSQQDANSGYEFWFFDPNGGYSYRHFRSHSTSHGYGTGAARAAHLRLNNWSVANQIPVGELLNVRVRGRVNGVNFEWGPACRFKLDPVAAACPMTKLMDIPGHQFLSCGQYREFAPGSYVHARPVSGASQYQFRFRQPAEGFEKIRTNSSYFTELWWPVNPLITGSQYEVDVRAMKNGVWCPWGEICTLNIGTNPGAQEGVGQTMMNTSATAELNMWPNPNRGDQLFISLSEVPEGTTTVSVDMFDLRGQRVMNQTLAANDGFLNTVIGLDGTLAAGMYMVNITAGEKVYTQRLVVQH